MTSEDRDYGKCPAKFSAKITVDVAYGTVTSAKASWAASGTKAHGEVDMSAAGYNQYTATLSGMPTKTPVVLTVKVTGPDGSVSADPFEITHPC